jgi:FkbM family methyltransferase
MRWWRRAGRPIEPAVTSSSPEEPPDSPEGVRLDYERASIWLYPTPHQPVKSRARAVAKEPWTVRWIEHAVRPGDVFWDVGANVGQYALIAASVAADVTVVAVEPAAQNYQALVRNVVRNAQERSIVTCPIALASADRLAGFAYRTLNPGDGTGHIVDVLDSEEVEGRDATLIQTPALSLDTLVMRAGLPAPDHLKLDIEGAELDVIRGASRVLSARAPTTVMIERENDDAMSAAVELLASFGLQHIRSFRKSVRSKALDAFFARTPDGLLEALAGVPERVPLAEQTAGVLGGTETDRL